MANAGRLLGVLWLLLFIGLVTSPVRAQIDCVHHALRRVEGMFLCGLEGEVRVTITNDCTFPVACDVELEGSRTEPVHLILEPAERVGSLSTSDRRRTEPGTTGCFDAEVPREPLRLHCVAETRAAIERAPPSLDPLPPTSPLGPLTEDVEEAPIRESESPPAAIVATDPDERALDEIALSDEDGAYRGASFHARLGIGAGYEAVPLFINGQSYVEGALLTDTERVTAHALGLATHFVIEPYRSEFFIVGARIEGALGAFGLDSSLSFVASGSLGLEFAIGYEWVFLLLDGAIGGRAVGVVSALDLRDYEARGGIASYARYRAGGGARLCLARGPYGGCPVELDLSVHWERADLALGPHLPTADALLLGAALAIDGGVSVRAELGWGYPYAGDAIAMPRDAGEGWMASLRVEKQFDWFGEAYVAPQVRCEPELLTGVWRTPEGARVLLEQVGEQVLLRSATVEGMGRVSGRGLRVEWVTDRGHVIDRLVVAEPDVLVRDGVTVLTRICE